VRFHRWVATFAALSASAGPIPPWRLARSQHFSIYGQTSDQRARAILTWFEQLRAFFEQASAGKISPPSPVTVVIFASEAEYQPYRLRATSDAYYVGTRNQDYIVMGADDPVKLGLAAHEYAHLVLRDSELQLPVWLKEGLAEFFATLRIQEHATELGGQLPGRVHTLERHGWMPLAQLMLLSEEGQQRQEREKADLFYAQSWALTEMLALSPSYAPEFPRFLTWVAAGSPGLKALLDIYSKSEDAVTHDLHVWVGRGKAPVLQLPEVATGAVSMLSSDVAPFASRLLLAQLLLAAGEFDRAALRFTSLSKEAPDSAEVSAGLGAIALHNGDSEGARRAWKRALDQGIADPKLAYQYAMLADEAGLPSDDIRPALYRAVGLQPDFDAARYRLALLEKNARNFDAALEQFHAMRAVAPARAYPYWLALADTFNELGRREDALSAARHASEHAVTTEEQSHAAEEIQIAQTDPGVQFARDAYGKLQLVTTRMPHQQSNWNPFIEPGDDIQHVRGMLREIDCGDQRTTIRLETADTVITLMITDLQHVQMRHAPSEFVCGPQDARRVTVDYARTGANEGIVRGMDFE
jgi:tetratricopeptide (TPR) repeat protein